MRERKVRWFDRAPWKGTCADWRYSVKRSIDAWVLSRCDGHVRSEVQKRRTFTHISNIDHQRPDVGSGLIMHQNLLFNGVADNIDNKPSALEVEGDGPRDGLRWGARNHDDLQSGAVASLLGPPFLAVSLCSGQDIYYAPNRDQPECHLELVLGNPVLDASVHGSRGNGLDDGPWWWRAARTSGFGEPRGI